MKALVLDGEFDPRPGYAVSEMERRTGIVRRGSNVWRHTRLEVKTVPDPEVGPEDVLIDIGRCGVCGSDLHLYETDADGYLIYPSWAKMPVIIGHEFSSTILRAVIFLSIAHAKVVPARLVVAAAARSCQAHTGSSTPSHGSGRATCFPHLERWRAPCLALTSCAIIRQGFAHWGQLEPNRPRSGDCTTWCRVWHTPP